jgi:hypothetical protein
MRYLLTAIGLTPGGSNTVHIYTQTIHRTTQNKQYIEQHKIWEVCGPFPVFASYTLAFALQLRKKHGKTSVRVAGECQLALWKHDIQRGTYVIISLSLSLPLWRCDQTRVMASSFLKLLDHTQRRTTVGRTPLDEWSARRRDLLPDNTQHSQQTNIHAPGGIRTHDLSRREDARPSHIHNNKNT